MSALEIGRPARRYKPVLNLLYLLLFIGVVAAIYFVSPRFEWHAPQITLAPDNDTIGLAPVSVEVNERGTGLKNFSATLNAGGTEHVLASEEYDEPAMQKKLIIALSSKLTGLKEGPAVLRVSARDRSLWRFFKGNQTVVERNLTIDITAPVVELIADDAYINFGGVGLVVYKPAPDTATSGVKIGDYFFPGYKGQTKDPNAYIAFFAHPYNAAESERAQLIATDKAGNTRQVRLPYTLMGVKYKKSTISLGDDFIEGKVAALLNDVGARQGSLSDIFVKVNRDIRKDNEEKIKRVTQKMTPTKLWDGAFTQLSNSKVEANFADARTYTHQGKVISDSYHLGFDLSVTKHYPVEAANNGNVAFAGDLGIYGNTVIVDHGLGLFTLYSHLSSIEVKEGDSIKKTQIIGKTGETGLAAGDHLHFGVYLHGVAVLPKEWWDDKWLRDNIYPKLEGELNGQPEAAAGESRAAKKVARRRR